jgi:hypothetical protein
MSILAGALIAGGIGLVQTIAGGVQRGRAKRDLDKLQMPKYEMPESVSQMVDIARRRAGSQMPGLDTMRADLSARTTGGVQASALAASSQSDLAAATRELYAEEMRGARQLGVMSAEYQAQREMELMGALGQQGQYEDRAFQINQMLPYEQKLQRYMSDLGTGGANIGAGIGNMLGAATGYMGSKIQLDTLDAWKSSLGQ